MTVTLSLRSLDNGEAPDELVQLVTSVVGAGYGYDTPISITTLLDTLGIDIAISLLNYALEDVRAASQNCAIDWVTDNLAPWNYVTESSARITELLFQCAQYMINAGTNNPERLDYCGEPLGGGAAYTAGALYALSDVLRDYIDTLPQTTSPANYYHVVSVSPGLSYGSNLLYGPTPDPAGSAYLPTISQSNRLIMDILNDPFETSFIQNSDIIDAQTIVEAGDTMLVAGLSYTGWGGTGVIRNDLNDGAYGVAQAAITTARMIAANSNSLGSVASSLVSAFSSYREGRLREIDRIYSRLKVISDTGMLPLSGDSYDTAIIDYEIAARNTALTDYTWIKQYDTNNNDRISAEERGNMQIGVRQLRIEARIAKATELHTALGLEVANFLTLIPDLETTFRLYFS